MEVYGRGRIVELANTSHRNLNVLGDQALDLRTLKPNGEPWDFNRLHMRNKAVRKLLQDKPLVLIGSPMCTDGGSMMELNWPKVSGDKNKRGCRRHVVIYVSV